MGLGLVHVSLLALVAPFRREALFLLLATLALSALAVVQYGVDKRAAGLGKGRIPEATLQTVALLGGWPGAALAQKLFRHKTRKASFQTTFRLVAFVNLGGVLALLGWLILSALVV